MESTKPVAGVAILAIRLICGKAADLIEKEGFNPTWRWRTGHPGGWNIIEALSNFAPGNDTTKCLHEIRKELDLHFRVSIADYENAPGRSGAHVAALLRSIGQKHQ